MGMMSSCEPTPTIPQETHDELERLRERVRVLDQGLREVQAQAFTGYSFPEFAQSKCRLIENVVVNTLYDALSTGEPEEEKEP